MHQSCGLDGCLSKGVVQECYGGKGGGEREGPGFHQ